MEIVTKKLNTANAIASGVIAKKDLENKISKVATRLSKTIKIDGFRKGKVPLALIQARYSENIKQDAQKEAVQEMLNLAIKDLGVDSSKVIGDPVIVKFDDKDQGIDVEIKISLTPEIKLDELDSCIPDFKLPKINDKEIQARLTEIANREAPFKEVAKTKKLENDHQAVFDFEGFIDGKPFDNGKAENFELIIGSKQFIPGFEEGMLGMKAGEERDIKVTFPENYQAKHLSGKEATFKIKLHQIKAREAALIDDELAKKLLPSKENATVQDLEEEIKKQLELEAKTKLYNEELKEKLIDNLAAKIKIDLPDLIVEQEMDVLFRNSLNAMSEEELKSLRESADKAREKRETFRGDAQKSVGVTFIIDALAKEKGISVQDNEVYQTIYYESIMAGQNPQEMVEYYKNNNLLPAIKMAMIEDRVLHSLLDLKIDNKDNQDKAVSKKSEKAPTKAKKASTKNKKSEE